jgi:hypothetical protein
MYTVTNIIQRSIIHLHARHSYIYTWRNSPCWSPLLPFVSPSTYLAPSSCDRNRPPPSQVACKLTPFAPPFTQLSQPFQIPTTPNCPTPINDDLGNIPAPAIRNSKCIRIVFASVQSSHFQGTRLFQLNNVLIHRIVAWIWEYVPPTVGILCLLYVISTHVYKYSVYHKWCLSTIHAYFL